MSAEAMAIIIAAMAGLAASQTGLAEPAVSQPDDASGDVPFGATAPDAAATLPPTEPVRPATPPRRQRAEQQSRNPMSGASFLNYKTLIDKEYRGESAKSSTTMVIFPEDAEKFIRACQIDPADVKNLSKDHQQESKALGQIRKKYCLKANPIAGQPPLLYRNIKAEGFSVCTTKLAVDAYEAYDVIKAAHERLVHKADVATKADLDKDYYYGITRRTWRRVVLVLCRQAGSCFKIGASCTSKCHGGRGSTTAKCYNTPNLDDPRLQVPGAFASRPCDAGAIDPAARKELLFKAANSLQGGMGVCIWVVGSDDLNGGPDDWVLGKLTHEAGHPRPFVVNYNDGTVKRYTAAPLSEAEDGALRHEVEMGYICATRMPTAAEWGTAAFGPAPVVAAGSKRSKAPPKRKPATAAVREKPAKAAKAATPPTTTEAHKAAPAQATSAGV
ncbi:hypothetical protein M885DRAFT_578707 [Pelagophyceae sp. CCMP2097]|nr:hypothetical protein M885DRAFT_578707 [Pelagophyceae sp. CCMP2097]